MKENKKLYIYIAKLKGVIWTLGLYLEPPKSSSPFSRHDRWLATINGINSHVT